MVAGCGGWTQLTASRGDHRDDERICGLPARHIRRHGACLRPRDLHDPKGYTEPQETGLRLHILHGADECSGTVPIRKNRHIWSFPHCGADLPGDAGSGSASSDPEAPTRWLARLALGVHVVVLRWTRCCSGCRSSVSHPGRTLLASHRRRNDPRVPGRGCLDLQESRRNAAVHWRSAGVNWRRVEPIAASSGPVPANEINCEASSLRDQLLAPQQPWPFPTLSGNDCRWSGNQTYR